MKPRRTSRRVYTSRLGASVPSLWWPPSATTDWGYVIIFGVCIVDCSDRTRSWRKETSNAVWLSSTRWWTSGTSTSLSSTKSSLCKQRWFNSICAYIDRCVLDRGAAVDAGLPDSSAPAKKDDEQVLVCGTCSAKMIS